MTPQALPSPLACLRTVLECLPLPALVLTPGGEVALSNQAWRALAPEAPTVLVLEDFETREQEPGILRLGERTFACRRGPLEGGFALVCLQALPAEGPSSARARFLSVAAHDVRGAIANARSFGALLLNPKMELDPKVRRGAEVIVRNSDRALSLVRDVFDSLRHELKAMPVLLEYQPLRPLLERAADQFRPLAGDRQVAFEAIFPEPLPDARVDGERVVHAVLGFLEHGLERVSDDGRLSLSARRTATGVEVRVSDDGPPLDDSALANLFTRDSRVTEANRLGGGFRLALSRDEIEAQGGSVGVFRGPAGQTVCFFTLPV